MRNVLCAILIMAIVIGGCGGRAAYPVQAQQVGDTEKSCEMLGREIAQLKYKLKAKRKQKAGDDGRNTGAFVGGIFTLGLAWTLIDTQGASGVELEALSARNSYLLSLAESKGCDVPKIVADYEAEMKKKWNQYIEKRRKEGVKLPFPIPSEKN